MEFLYNLYVRYADPAFQARKVGCWVWILTTQTDVSYPIGSMYAIYGNMDPINVPQMLAYIPAPWIQIISSKKWPPPFPETSGTSCGPGPGREIRWLAPPMVWFAKESKGMN